MWAWPRSTARLLRTAFHGAALAEDFEARRDGAHIGEEQVAWLRQFLAEMDNARQRHHRLVSGHNATGVVTPDILDIRAVAARFVTLVDRSDQQQGLWAENIGYGCPDDVGEPIEPPIQQLEDLLGRQLGGGTVWPLTQRAAEAWSQDDLFDLMEVLHDLASWPGTWDSHDFGGCPGHPGDFSAECGRALPPRVERTPRPKRPRGPDRQHWR